MRKHLLSSFILIMLSPAASFLVRRSCRQSTRYIATQSVTDIMMQDAIRETQTLVGYYGASTTAGGPTIWTTREDAASFVRENVDAVLFDCDGVLYRGKDKSPHASEVLKALLENGKQCFFVTNNAAANRQQLQAKLSEMMECPGLTVEQMIGSTYACSRYLKDNLPVESRVHVIGSEGLCQEISESGFVVTGGPCEDDPAGMSREELADYDFPAHPIDAVCVGLDTMFTYRKLAIANVLLQRNPHAILVSTNQDAFDLVGGDARHLPGNGCLVKALEHGSRRKAINVGKPSAILAEMIIREHKLDPARTMFVGDRLDTDIKFGKENGMISVLVMSGVTTAETMIALGEHGNEEEPIPQIIMPFMGMLA